MNTQNDDINFYFDVIDGKSELPESLFKDKPEELKNGLVLEYVFDKLEESENKKVANRLLKYIDPDPNLYSSRKFLSIRALGILGDHEVESLIATHIESKNPDIAFIALSSMCEMMERDVLSKNMKDIMLCKFEKIMTDLSYPAQDTLECARVLKHLNYKNIDDLILNAEKRFPGFTNELKAIM